MRDLADGTLIGGKHFSEPAWKAAESLPAERLVSAVRAGVRHAANNQYLRATMMRVLAFFPFASAYLALLPLLARHQISGGPQDYGILLGAIGVGAVGGALAMRWLKDELGPERQLYIDSSRPVSANTGHSATAWRTGQIDPKATYRFDAMNGWKARESRLWLMA